MIGAEEVGVRLILNVLLVLCAQALTARTASVPLTNEALNATVTNVVPWPEVIVAFAGAVH